MIAVVRSGHVTLAAWAAFGLGAFVACGGDDEAPNRSGAGAGGGAGTSSSGTGGTGRDASAGSDGSGASGTGGSAGDAGPDAGLCTPRNQVKDPIYSSITAESSCTAKTPCGGALADGDWSLTEACIEAGDPLSADPRAAARRRRSDRASTPVRAARSPSPAAQLTLSFKAIALGVHRFSERVPRLPLHGPREQSAPRAGLTGMSCSPQCAGGSCFCNVSKTIDVSVCRAVHDPGHGDRHRLESDVRLLRGRRRAHAAGVRRRALPHVSPDSQTS